MENRSGCIVGAGIENGKSCASRTAATLAACTTGPSGGTIATGAYFAARIRAASTTSTAVTAITTGTTSTTGTAGTYTDFRVNKLTTCTVVKQID